MHQVATLSVQVALGSALVDWYRDATSVLFGHLLIDLFPRTDDRLCYSTNSGNFPTKFYVPYNLKHLKEIDEERSKSLYYPNVPTLFTRMQNSVSKNLSKRRIYPIYQRVHRQPAARKLVRSKKKSRPKTQRQSSRTPFEKNNLEATKNSLFVAKKLIAHKNFSPFVINLCLEMEQFVLEPFLSATTATTQQLSQNKNYPNINLSKLPRTTKIR